MSPLRLNGSTSGSVSLDCPAVGGNNTLVLPTGNGSSGQVLTTNGSGALSWGSVTSSKILQVVQATKTDQQSGSANAQTWTDITGLSVAITPSSSSSKILVMSMVTFGFSSDCALRLMRNSTSILEGDSAGSRLRITTSAQRGDYEAPGAPIMYLDSPATTSSTTYKIQAISTGSVWYVNGEPNQADNIGVHRGASSLILMEVTA